MIITILAVVLPLDAKFKMLLRDSIRSTRKNNQKINLNVIIKVCIYFLLTHNSTFKNTHSQFFY